MIIIQVKSYKFINHKLNDFDKDRIFYKINFIDKFNPDKIISHENDIVEKNFLDYIKSDLIKIQYDWNFHDKDIQFEYDIRPTKEKLKLYFFITTKDNIKNNKIVFDWDLRVFKNFEKFATDGIVEHYRRTLKQFYGYKSIDVKQIKKDFEKDLIDFIIEDEVNKKEINQDPDNYIVEYIFDKHIGIEKRLKLDERYIKLDLENQRVGLPEKLITISFLKQIDNKNEVDNILVSTDEGLKSINKYVFALNYKLVDNGI